MEAMRTAVAAVCAVSAVTGLISVFAGGLKLKGQLVMIMDMLLLTVIITPFVSGSAEFGMPEPDTFITDNYSCSEALYRSALEMQTVENIAEVLAEQTDAAGCHCERIVPFINISEDMSISIIRVEIKAEDFESAAAVVRSSLGTDTEVVNGSDG